MHHERSASGANWPRPLAASRRWCISLRSMHPTVRTVWLYPRVSVHQLAGISGARARQLPRTGGAGTSLPLPLALLRSSLRLRRRQRLSSPFRRLIRVVERRGRQPPAAPVIMIDPGKPDFVLGAGPRVVNDRQAIAPAVGEFPLGLDVDGRHEGTKVGVRESGFENRVGSNENVERDRRSTPVSGAGSAEGVSNESSGPGSVRTKRSTAP